MLQKAARHPCLASSVMPELGASHVLAPGLPLASLAPIPVLADLTSVDLVVPLTPKEFQVAHKTIKSFM